MNDKLQAIAAKAAEDLLGLIADGDEKIRAAWSEAECQAALEETKPKFSLAFKITLDLDKNTMDSDLSWSTKHHLGVTSKLPDPTQPELPGVEPETVTMETDSGKSVVFSAETFRNIPKIIKKMQEQSE